MERKCIVCGGKLVGRADQKFCGDFCRNSYNNELRRDSNNLVRNINNLLRKNYRILENINVDNKTKTTKNRLLQEGFNFDYFTSIYVTKTGSTYYYLYDQGYLELDNDFILLVKKEMK